MWWGLEARSQNCEKGLLASSCLSVRPSAWDSALAGRIFMKFDMSTFRKCAEEIQVLIKSDKNEAFLT